MACADCSSSLLKGRLMRQLFKLLRRGHGICLPGWALPEFSG